LRHAADDRVVRRRHWTTGEGCNGQRSVGEIETPREQATLTGCALRDRLILAVPDGPDPSALAIAAILIGGKKDAEPAVPLLPHDMRLDRSVQEADER
jgi:hypothetical protein